MKLYETVLIFLSTIVVKIRSDNDFSSRHPKVAKPHGFWRSNFFCKHSEFDTFILVLMQLSIALLFFVMFSSSISAFRGLQIKKSVSSLVSRRMITITNGVEFDTIAREWRLKWSADADKKSLADVQQNLNKFGASLKAVDGVKSVQRIVCGGCHDYKVIVSLPAEKFSAWVRLLHF